MKSVYEEAKSIIKTLFGSTYKKLKQMLQRAQQANNPVEYNAAKQHLGELNRKALAIAEANRASARPDRGGNADSNKHIIQRMIDLNKQYAEVKKLARSARHSGNASEYNQRKASLSGIVAQLYGLKLQYAGQNDVVNAGVRFSEDDAAADNGATAFQSSWGAQEDNIAVNGSEPVFTSRLWNTEKGVGNNNCYSYAMNNFSADRPSKAVPGDRSGYTHDLDYKSCPLVKLRLLQDNPDSIHPEKPENKCRPGFYKIMMFVGERDSRSPYGDFHFYKHHRDIEYKVGPSDTVETVAEKLNTTRQRVLQAVAASASNAQLPNQNARPLEPGMVLMFKNFRTQAGRTLWSHKLGWATGALLDDACGKIITDPRKSCRKFSTIDYTKYCGAYCIRNGVAKSSSGRAAF